MISNGTAMAGMMPISIPGMCPFVTVATRIANATSTAVTATPCQVLGRYP
jgi:hypothetical protein